MPPLANNSDRPNRPPRLHQVYATSPLYFVTFGTWDRKPLLANDSTQQAFLIAAAKIGTAGNAVGRYVIMPDHIHVFLRMGLNGKLGLAVKCIKDAITKSFPANGKAGQAWQPGFFDHMLRSSESYSEKWAYVRANPVRAGLAGIVDEWPFQGEIVTITW